MSTRTPTCGPTLRDLEFVRLVAEHWSTLKELLADQLPGRLSAYGDAVTFWTAMCTVAAAYPDTQPDVLRAIDTSLQVAASAQALRFTAAAGPARLSCSIS